MICKDVGCIVLLRNEFLSIDQLWTRNGRVEEKKRRNAEDECNVHAIRRSVRLRVPGGLCRARNNESWNPRPVRVHAATWVNVRISGQQYHLVTTQGDVRDRESWAWARDMRQKFASTRHRAHLRPHEIACPRRGGSRENKEEERRRTF